MERELQTFRDFLREAVDPAYFQDTFNFTVLISMDKNRGGSRDETKNDIRALPEVLTVTLIEKEKGGVQKDLGNTYLSTLKIHIRRPRDTSKELMMKRVVKQIARLKGVSVLRYKERKPKQRKKAFYGAGSYTKRVQNVNEQDVSEGDYYQSAKHKSDLKKDFVELTSKGPQKKGGYKNVSGSPDFESSPPGAPGGLEEAILDEAMKTAADLPEGVVVVVLKESDGSGFQVYYALRDKPTVRLKAGDLDRIEAGIDIFGTLHVGRGRNEPYENVYIIQSSKAKDGFGPLLYDVALEVAGKSGLKPDLLEVSDDASAVWKYYDDQREDVDSKMLVRSVEDFDKVMPEDRADNPGDNMHLAQVYYKTDKGTTEELTGQNKLIELNPSIGVSRSTPKADLEDLAAELEIPIVSRQRFSNDDLKRFDRLREDILISIGDDEDELATFEMQPDLQQKVWDGDKRVHPGVKAALMDIVDEFIERLDLDADIKDIIITGSLANYNWSRFSDIDLHILIDFGEVNDNEELVKRFFDAVRSNWNKLHNIKVKGHEVELYVQDESEPHVSTGVYSLLNDKWLVKPNKVKPFIDKKTAKKKAANIEREVDKVASILYDGDHDAALKAAANLKEKIKTMRQTGLEKAGIFSPENLAFKMLRRSEAIGKLHDVYTRAYDLALSLDQ
jgi:predicted nucleotidyltransferase